VPLEYWHLLTSFSPADVASFGEGAIGRTLITDGGFVLGFGGVFFQKNEHGDAVAVLFFYGGPNQVFVRKYIKLALKGMQSLFFKLIELGVFHVYTVADRRIDKSVSLVRWLGGTPTGHEQEEGEVYVIPLADTPLTRPKD
jgi:hypothetical protein